MREFQFYGVLLSVGLICVLVYSSAQLTDGSFYFTLDDPYIHLSVAEQILRGEYGVNQGEYSSPSSSILYPFLLALPLFAGLGSLAPLVIAVPAQIAAVWIFSGLIWRFGVLPERAGSRMSAFILLPFFLAAINAFALPLTGMEHSLHVLAAIMVTAGLIDLEANKPAPALLVAGIVLGPLIRFEGVVLSGAAILPLFWYGHRVYALTSLAVVCASFVAYWALMSRLGLPFLPSSVLTKSEAAASLAEGTLMDDTARLLANFASNVSGMGQFLAFSVFLIVMGAAVRHPESEKRFVIAVVLVKPDDLAIEFPGFVKLVVPFL